MKSMPPLDPQSIAATFWYDSNLHSDFILRTILSSAGCLVVAPGSTIEVSTGDRVAMQWVPSDADFDEYTVLTEDGTELLVSDVLIGAWWTTDDANSFEVDEFSGTSVDWVVGNEPGTKFVYLVVRDGSGAESLAWFRFEVSQG